MICENPGHARGASPFRVFLRAPDAGRADRAAVASRRPPSVLLLLVLLVAFVLFAPPGPSAAPTAAGRAPASDAEDWRAEAEAAARTVFERNLAAIEARDTEAYLACYRQDEHLVRVGFDGISRGYEGLAAGTGENWPDHFEAHDLQVFALGPAVAYGRYRYRVTYGEEIVEGLSERVFLRTDAGWRIAVTTAFEAPPGALPEPGATDDGGERR